MGIVLTHGVRGRAGGEVSPRCISETIIRCGKLVGGHRSGGTLVGGHRSAMSWHDLDLTFDLVVDLEFEILFRAASQKQ